MQKAHLESMEHQILFIAGLQSFYHPPLRWKSAKWKREIARFRTWGIVGSCLEVDLTCCPCLAHPTPHMKRLFSAPPYHTTTPPTYAARSGLLRPGTREKPRIVRLAEKSVKDQLKRLTTRMLHRTPHQASAKFQRAQKLKRRGA